ncbi:MAG: hypothetical protein ACK5XN_14605, partial [Bacteroidota bacterium]
MNNSVFGKCLENVAKRINVDLMTDSKKFVKKTSKPNFKDFRIFSEGLAAVEMSKTEVVYNRPMIVGFAILELSKLHMYNFHYNVMKKEFKDDIKLLFTDTDSLCYHIKTENFFDFMKKNLDEFDTSEFPSTHECYSTKNKKVIYKFKCEANGKINDDPELEKERNLSLPNQVVEFCGHRSKMYCILKDHEYKKNKAVAKGIKKTQIKKLKMEQYKRALFGETKDELKHTVTFNLLRST